jgi:hypothetical protein
VRGIGILGNSVPLQASLQYMRTFSGKEVFMLRFIVYGIRWGLLHRRVIAVVSGFIVLTVVCVLVWSLLVGYVNPKDAAERKDVVQTFALLVAGIIGAISGIVAIANLRQQRVLAEARAREDVLQDYFKQMGDLLTNHNLISTDREDIKQLARAQTLTLLRRMGGGGKGQVVRFLYGAGLIDSAKVVVPLMRANLYEADLDATELSGANLSGAILTFAYLRNAGLRGTDLTGSKLFGSNLRGADLSGADLSGADLRWAKVTEEQLATCKSFEGASMPKPQIIGFDPARGRGPFYEDDVRPKL